MNCEISRPAQCYSVLLLTIVGHLLLMKMTGMTFWASGFCLSCFSALQSTEMSGQGTSFSASSLLCLSQPAFGQWALEASWSSCWVPGPRWFSVRWQNFSPWKKTNRCVLQSCCEMNLLSANSAVECWWTYSDDTLDLCLLTVLWGDGKKVDSYSLIFFFFCYWCWNILCWKIICLFFGNTKRVSTGRELPFYTDIPSVEACSLCTNSVFSHKVLLRNCKGLRSTCMCSALLVWNKACSFPLLHLPVQMKGSMPCGCSWKENSCSFNYLPCHRNLIWPQKSHFFLLLPCFHMFTVGMLNVFLPCGDTYPVLQWRGGSE